jgi:hypothetical protein
MSAALWLKPLCVFALALSVLLGLAGCATPSGGVISMPVVTSRPVSLDSIVVTTASSLPDLAAEKTLLNDRIISGLRETGLFASVGADGAGTNSGNGIKVAVDIKAITKVSDDSRQWFGGLAGQAAITVQVTVTDLSSGRQIEIFNAEGKSGASARAGTTEAAINQVAGQVVAEVVKLNAQTSQ